jgi:hypothetical protein
MISQKSRNDFIFIVLIFIVQTMMNIIFISLITTIQVNKRFFFKITTNKRAKKKEQKK